MGREETPPEYPTVSLDKRMAIRADNSHASSTFDNAKDQPLGVDPPDAECAGLTKSPLVSSTCSPGKLKHVCSFKQFPRLQMIGDHGDHCADLQDCLVRFPAIQQLSGEGQAGVRVGRR